MGVSVNGSILPVPVLWTLYFTSHLQQSLCELILNYTYQYQKRVDHSAIHSLYSVHQKTYSFIPTAATAAEDLADGTSPPVIILFNV